MRTAERLINERLGHQGGGEAVSETRVFGGIGKQKAMMNRRLDSGLRKKLNALISDQTDSYKPDIPLRRIADLLRQAGLILVQEDNTEWAGVFTGRDGTALIRLGWLDSAHGPQNDPFYDLVPNSALSISWHKMETGTWETVAYLS